MARVDQRPVAFVAEWIDGDGVTSPELRSTWARYEVWLNDRCVTQVEDGDGSFRKSVFGSLYPLAEWVAENWWSLATEVRPSGVPRRAWGWSNVDHENWLRRHNFRGAGDGMAWPDLTVVPEGSVTRFLWHSDHSSNVGRIRFAGEGEVLVPTAEASAGLRDLVDRVLVRLTEQGVADTPLQSAWAAIQAADDEEAQFCRAAARLGWDPYYVEGDLADLLISLEASIPSHVLADFLDTADPSALQAAVDWFRRAQSSAARKAAGATTESITTLQTAIGDVGIAEAGRPWLRGYAMAHRIREVSAVGNTSEINCGRWVAKVSLSAPPHGLEGVGHRTAQSLCAVALPGQMPSTSERFAQARALGRALARPDQDLFVLSSARADDEKLARAFAAELLAPATGIRSSMDVLGSSDDAAIEAIARQYAVSPLLIRHQYDNQILERAG